MTSHHELVPTGEVVTWVTLKELCRVGRCSADWIMLLVEEGILEPDGAEQSDWRFPNYSLSVVHRVRRLETDLGVNLAGIAVVLDLVAENAKLKRRVDHLEQETAPPIWQAGPV